MEATEHERSGSVLSGEREREDERASFAGWMNSARAYLDREDGSSEAYAAFQTIESAREDFIGVDREQMVEALDALMRAPAIWSVDVHRHIPAVELLAASDSFDEGDHRGAALKAIARFLANSADIELALEVKRLLIEGSSAIPDGVVVACVYALWQHFGEVQHIIGHLHHSARGALAADLGRRFAITGRAVRDTYLIMAFNETSARAAELALALGLRHFPADPVLSIELAKRLRDGGQIRRAGQLALALLNDDAGNSDRVAECLMILLNAHRFPDVLSAYDTLPAPIRTINVITVAAQAAIKLGKFGCAIEHARAALAIDADNVHAMLLLAEAAARLAGASMTVADVEERVVNDARVEVKSAYLDHLIMALKENVEDVDRANIQSLAPLARRMDIALRPSQIIDVLRLTLDSGFDAEAAQFLGRFARGMDMTLDAAVEIAISAGIPAALASEAGGLEQLAGVIIAFAGQTVHSTIHQRTLNTLVSILLPRDQIARLRAGLDLLGVGDCEEAQRNFEGLERGFPIGSRQINWPIEFMGEHWPHVEEDVPPEMFVSAIGDREWPRITLIIPSLDQARFVEEALLSVLRQGYPALELIFVDGGSTDGTLQIVEKYSDHIHRLEILPGSQSVAINHGFSISTGDILGWLNTDDLLMPGSLHAIALAFLENDADVIIGDCLIFREERIEQVVVANRDAQILDRQELLDVYENWLAGNFICQPEAFISRRALTLIGGKVDETLEYTMDYAMWLELAERGARRISIAWPVAATRKHNRQKTARVFPVFKEMLGVRETHAAARDADAAVQLPRARDALAKSGPIHLCVWDAPTQSPLRLAAASGLQISTPGGRDVEFCVPYQLTADAPLTVHLFGLLGPRPSVEVAENVINATSGFNIAWFWNVADQFVDKRRLSMLFDLVVPSHLENGQYLANRSEAVPVLPQASLIPANGCSPENRESIALVKMPFGDEGAPAGASDGKAPEGAEWIDYSRIMSRSAGEFTRYREALGSYRKVMVPTLYGEIPEIAFSAVAAGTSVVLTTSGRPPDNGDGMIWADVSDSDAIRAALRGDTPLPAAIDDVSTRIDQLIQLMGAR